jgi:glycine cleavage system H protein
MTAIPGDLRYSADHPWVCVDTGTSLVRAGLTDFAQQSLGDVVEVTLPRIGATVTAGDACGDIESAKTADLAAPVTGTVCAHNDDLTPIPELVNADPCGQGWMPRSTLTPPRWTRSSLA